MCSIGNAAGSERPADVGVANFQFGPHNRWAFSHIREVLTTANIAHDRNHVMELRKSGAFSGDFTIEFQEASQSIVKIAEQQYIDGVYWYCATAKSCTRRITAH